ncbi:unnamed protein product, partial [Prunus brigantina]
GIGKGGAKAYTWDLAGYHKNGSQGQRCLHKSLNPIAAVLIQSIVCLSFPLFRNQREERLGSL